VGVAIVTVCRLRRGKGWGGNGGHPGDRARRPQKRRGGKGVWSTSTNQTSPTRACNTPHQTMKPRGRGGPRRSPPQHPPTPLQTVPVRGKEDAAAASARGGHPTPRQQRRGRRPRRRGGRTAGGDRGRRREQRRQWQKGQAHGVRGAAAGGGVGAGGGAVGRRQVPAVAAAAIAAGRGGGGMPLQVDRPKGRGKLPAARAAGVEGAAGRTGARQAHQVCVVRLAVWSQIT